MQKFFERFLIENGDKSSPKIVKKKLEEKSGLSLSFSSDDELIELYQKYLNNSKVTEDLFCLDLNESNKIVPSNKRIDAIDHAFYRFATKCYDERLNIIFKGGCLLRHILRSYNLFNIRGTEDIDLDVLEDTYLELDTNYREYINLRKLTEHMMCNATLYDGDIECDIHVVPKFHSDSVAIYTCSYGKFIGANIIHILCDKISAISTDAVRWRAKDIIDLYVIITTKIHSEVDYILFKQFLGLRSVGDFSHYFNRENDLETRINEMGFDANRYLRVCDIYLKGLIDNKHKWTGSNWL